MSVHDVFLSYSRKDNSASAPGLEGWVTAFHRRLTEHHQRYAGHPLRVFFDKTEIGSDEDWERRIAQGLRSSSLFIAFLSPNYVASPICRREWEEYLRLEHTLARGDDGIKQIYFVQVPGLHGNARDGFGPDMADWIADIRRRNLHHSFDLTSWYAGGAEQLRELDAEERLAALRADPRSDHDRQIVGLAEQIAAIDKAIAQRLDRATLADLAPGNLDASYGDFVGRSRELRKLHTSLVADKVGLVSALHGLGGQGKTALVVQYAYAYAGHYAAGGRWLVPCEGVRHLADALEILSSIMGFSLPDVPAGLSGQRSRAFLVKAVVEILHQRVLAGATEIATRLARQPGLHSQAADLPPVHAHVLLILDNVDHAALLSAEEAASLAGQPWLQIVLTTRLDPATIGASRDFALIPVDDLPPEDALALLRRLRPFVADGDETAARVIVERLGGFTLGIELVGAYLASHEGISYSGYLSRLANEGLPGLDRLSADAKTADMLRYEREKQIGRIIDDTMAGLSEAAREILAVAALFPPDQIVVEWLQAIVVQRMPFLAGERVESGYPDPWHEALRELQGRRLLLESTIVNKFRPELAILRLHRLVASHVEQGEPHAASESRWLNILALIDALATFFEANWASAPRPLLWIVGPLQAWLERIHGARPTAETARALSILSDADLNLGLLARAGQAREESLATLQRLYDANPDDAQAARDVSVSLNRMGDFYLRRGGAGDSERARDAFAESLGTRKRLYDANPDDAQAARDVSVSLNRMGDFYLRRGSADDAERARDAFTESLATLRRLYDANPDDAQAARDVSISLDRMGDFYLRRGSADDAERARDAFAESLATSKRLYDANPDDAQAARDVSVSLDLMGAFYLRRGGAGDSERARDAFAESLATRKRLYDANPDDAQAARDVSVSLNRMGDFYLRRGSADDAERAREAFAESLATLQRLYDANPDDAQAARDVSISLDRMGDFYLRRGSADDAERARDAFAESLATLRRLYDANPDDAQAARDVSISLDRMGDFYLRRGSADDAERARDAFAESLATSKRLYDANPDDAQAARDVSVSLDLMGAFYLRRGGAGDSERARDAFAESLATRKRLYDANPDDAQAARDVSVSLNKMGDFYLRRGSADDAERARDAFAESLATSKRLYDANPDDAQAARDVSVSLDLMGAFYLRRGGAGDSERARDAFAESLATRKRLYDANPDDAQAARDVSVSLNKMGDFYLRRGSADDSERAREAFAESLATSKRLYDANPDDAQAARDVSVSLDLMGDFYLRRGGAGDSERARDAFTESLATLQCLYDANPDDAQAARDVSVSHYLLAQAHTADGEDQHAQRSLAACFAVLDRLQREGRPLDDAMRDLHALLAQAFGPAAMPPDQG